MRTRRFCNAPSPSPVRPPPRAAFDALDVASALADDEFERLLTQVALHERLVYAQHPSPGIIGLPLSSNDEGVLGIDAAASLLEELTQIDASQDSEIVAGVRTLCDLVRLHRHEVDAIAPLLERAEELIDPLTEHDVEAIALAARRTLTHIGPMSPLGMPTPEDDEAAMIAGLDAPNATDHFVEMSADHGPLGLWALLQLATELDEEDAARALARAWMIVPMTRVEIVRDMLQSLDDV